jgi:hypothetical protein
MAGLGPAIHVFTYGQDVDARVKPAHDGASDSTSSKNASRRLREEGDDVTSEAERRQPAEVSAHARQSLGPRPRGVILTNNPHCDCGGRGSP